MRKLTQIIVILLLYYLTARLGFLMALPPGNVTALWPPSGLALAAMLVLGWESSIGIFLGSLIPETSRLRARISSLMPRPSTLFAYRVRPRPTILKAG